MNVQPGRPEKIIFTGDFLRPSAEGLHPTQHENIEWLSKILRVPVGMATSLPSETVHWDNNWINGARLDSAAVEAIYSAFGRRVDIHTWAYVFAASTLPDAVEELFVRLFANSLVIGFELPPYLSVFCTRHNIPFINVSISPVRFLDDLLIRISPSTSDMTAALHPYRITEDLIRLQAGVLSSTVAKANLTPPRPDSLLLILQTRFDKVVVENGCFTSVLDHLDELRDIAADYDNVLIKEHPLEAQPEVRDALQNALFGSQVTRENFYRLVAHDNLRGVVALSSSCVAEAGYFGKKGHYLISGFDPDRLVHGHESVDVDATVLAPDFWRDLLSTAGCPVSVKDGLRLPTKPNRFRQHLRSAWGYNHVDTDIFVQWATN
jgi:hypothetical protein